MSKSNLQPLFIEKHGGVVAFTCPQLLHYQYYVMSIWCQLNLMLDIWLIGTAISSL